MDIKIKICGICEQRNMADVIKLEPDLMGFIFFPMSPRNVINAIPPEEFGKVPSGISKTGVFVDEDINIVQNRIHEYSLDIIQLHGNEAPDYCGRLKKTGIKVIKAFHIKDQFDFMKCGAYLPYTSCFLFDTATEKPGGSGRKFDWTILENYKFDHPFILSGGIAPGDHHKILGISHPAFRGVDLNSKFEKEKGIKDISALKDFIKEIRKKDWIMNKTFTASTKGYYGDFGGAYIPEMLRYNIKSLEKVYYRIIESEAYQKEFRKLLRDYAGRPTPLFYAGNLSKKYGLKIYLKREDLNHTGSHKINNAIGQILLAKELGKTRIIAETGAGQHGVAAATVSALMGMQCVVYMGETDMERQLPNVERMRMLGAKVVPVKSGNRTLKDATNEALRDWIKNPEDTFYLIGSVVGPHPYPDMVARFQSVISEELLIQISEAENRKDPDIIIACIGGGSNAAGIFYHYLNTKNVRLIGVEAAGYGVETGLTAATIAVGSTGIIHGSKTLLMQDDDGQITEPYSISAGLDYPGVGPFHAWLAKTGRAEYMNVTDKEALEAAYELTLMEGIIPALESAHALAVLNKLKKDEGKVVVLNLSGRGDKDMKAYVNAKSLINKKH